MKIKYVSKSQVSSRVFIQKSISAEPYIADILRTKQNMYMGYILTALELDTLIDGTRTVRDVLSTISTESYKDIISIAQESFIFEAKPENKGVSSKVISPEISDLNFPSGKIIELTIPTASGGLFKINVFLQLLPTIFPDDLVESFISLNIEPSFMQRYYQYTAGEISFWKDLLFQCDLRKERKRILKSDADDTIKDMLSTQSKNPLDTSELNRLFNV